MMSTVFFAGLVISISTSKVLGMETEGCQSPQYLEIGGTGVVHCHFFSNVYGVLWFNSTEIDRGNPFIQLVDSQKSGDGYLMGSYDIYLNGSFLIKKVLPLHDQTFTVVKFASETEHPVSFSVVVITTVVSTVGHPVIAECGTEHRSCYAQLDGTSEVNCFIRDTRPAIPLKWLVRTAGIYRNVPSDVNVTCNTITYTSRVMARNLFKNSTLLSLLVCKADSIPGMLREDESYIITENPDIAVDMKPVKVFIKHNSELKLSCSDLKVDILVWKKQEYFADTFEIIAYAYLSGNNFSKIFHDHYMLDEDGSLIVPRAQERDEGIYECSFENGLTGSKNPFAVVYAPNTPPTITCPADVIVKVNEGATGAFVTFTPPFCIDPDQSNQKLALSCNPMDNSFLPLGLNTVTCTCTDHSGATDNCSFTATVFDEPDRMSNDQSETPVDEEIVLAVSTTAPHTSQTDPKLRTLIEELKAMYKIQYGSVQPTTKKLCVNSIFVDCVYKLMTSTSNERELHSWETVKTYKEVLQRIDVPSVVTIEGGPGSGKSTLALQLAYDWCNGIGSSPIHDKEILILLRLIDVGSVESVYKAIKEQILPRDSSLSEMDIKSLLRFCNSGVLILDGFDEYPDLSSDNKSDIMSIVRGEMFQRFLVLITTRSFSLLKSLSPNTHRLKLAGFDEETRNQYIWNVVAKRDRQKKDKINRCLHNVFITDLVKIPLLYTIIAHISVEEGGLKNFRSLSGIVRLIINCLHTRMERRMLKTDRKTVKSYIQRHKKLDDLAFQIVIGRHKPSLTKIDICEQLGKEFYDYYKRVGILVENSDFNPTTLRSKTEVHFFHELLCEWYAAHCLLRKFEESELGLQDIETQLFELRTVCLLACGISADFAEKTVKYLVQSPDHEKFAFLCYVESVKKVDKISNEVNKILASEVILDIDQDKLLTWSTIQLLMIASRNEMPISCLQLNAYKSPVELSDGALILQADIYLPYLTTLEQLVIYEFKDMQATDEKNILKYSSMCDNIKSLKFYHCNVVRTIRDACLKSLKSRNVSVEWVTPSSSFCMNLRRGLWEREGTPLTKEEYVKEIEDIQRHLG